MLAILNDERCGAVVLFLGRTRRWTGDDPSTMKATVELHYDAYREMAIREMERLRDEVCRKHPGMRVALVHRLGLVEIGQNSVAVAVACPHRKAAFEAGKWLIDELKRQVPIWKRETWEDGSQSWQHPQGDPTS